MCFSNKARTPGVWAMSPMFTVCHEERKRMRGRFPFAEKPRAPSAAMTPVPKKVRLFINLHH
jgi:hypothetical protein